MISHKFNIEGWADLEKPDCYLELIQKYITPIMSHQLKHPLCWLLIFVAGLS